MTDALHTAWAKVLIGSLQKAGVRHVVVSPGSRSTPLALAASNTSGVKVHVVVDERSAGFFALAQSRLTGMPSALVCTSGTAGAHYYPAIIEAAQAGIPLIAVTADRPPELQQCGANQTINQHGLFGRYVAQEFQLGVPDLPALPALHRVALQAVHAALLRGGPVHINAPFRKPLEPTPGSDAQVNEWSDKLLSRPAPHRPVEPPVSDSTARELAHALAGAKRPMIVAGPLSPRAGITWRDSARELSAAATELATCAGTPIFAEGTSGITPDAARPAAGVFANLNLAFRLDAFGPDGGPDLIIEVGAPPISTGYARFVSRHADITRITLTRSGYPNPTHGDCQIVPCDPASLLARAAKHVQHRPRPTPWMDSVSHLAELCSRAAVEACEGVELSEASVARLMTQTLPTGTTLLVGNSLPVRDLDLYGNTLPDNVTVLHQRGASGIDGWLSSTAGVASATDGPVCAWMGDVTALHDVGSLGLLRDVAPPVLVVVVNNGGGRIFGELPIAQVPELDADLERLFYTPPPDHYLAGVARGFGLKYQGVHEQAELRDAVCQALRCPGATVIEAFVPPDGGRRSRALALTRAKKLFTTQTAEA